MRKPKSNHSTSADGTSDVCTSVFAKPFPKIGPHGEVAFPTRSLVTAYSGNLFKLGKKYLCSTIGKGYFMISFTHGTAQNSCVLPCVNDTLWFSFTYGTRQNSCVTPWFPLYVVSRPILKKKLEWYLLQMSSGRQNSYGHDFYSFFLIFSW